MSPANELLVPMFITLANFCVAVRLSVYLPDHERFLVVTVPFRIYSCVGRP